eukprot:GHVU01035520.1.p1 GENE.GHVU01035520.1~~GHVU01035520.1.p1  ORF type:complete len:481 (+),score=65.35 GHVU01035520.1:838-2280(+)
MHRSRRPSLWLPTGTLLPLLHLLVLLLAEAGAHPPPGAGAIRHVVPDGGASAFTKGPARSGAADTRGSQRVRAGAAAGTTKFEEGRGGIRGIPWQSASKESTGRVASATVVGAISRDEAALLTVAAAAPGRGAALAAAATALGGAVPVEVHATGLGAGGAGADAMPSAGDGGVADALDYATPANQLFHLSAAPANGGLDIRRYSVLRVRGEWDTRHFQPTGSADNSSGSSRVGRNATVAGTSSGGFPWASLLSGKGRGRVQSKATIPGCVAFFTSGDAVSRSRSLPLVPAPRLGLDVRLEGRGFHEHNLVSLKITRGCGGYPKQDAFLTAVADPASGMDTTVYRFSEDWRLHSSRIPRWRYYQRSLIHGQRPTPFPIGDLKLLVCFYDSDQQLSGSSLGFTIVRPDKNDVLELVLLIFFVVMAIPILCGVTLTCYTYKHRHVRRCLRRSHFANRRDHIEGQVLNIMGLDSSLNPTVDVDG